MQTDLTELFIIRHGNVQLAYDENNRKKIHQSNVPINDVGFQRMCDLSLLLHENGYQTMDVILSSPRPRALISAAAFRLTIGSAYKDDASFKKDDFFQERYRQKLNQVGINLLTLDYPVADNIQKLMEGVRDETKLERTVRGLGIITDDRLCDVLAPSKEWEGMPLQLWQKQAENEKLSRHNVLQAQIFLNDIISDPSKKKLTILTHQNTALLLTDLLVRNMLEPTNEEYLTPKELDSIYSIKRAEGKRLFVDGNGKVLKIDTITPEGIVEFSVEGNKNRVIEKIGRNRERYE